MNDLLKPHFSLVGETVSIEMFIDGKGINFNNPIEPSFLKDLDVAAELQRQGINGSICIISGMPSYLICCLTSQVKNLFSTVAIYDPKVLPLDGGEEGAKYAVVVHSISPDYPLGQVVEIPLTIG